MRTINWMDTHRQVRRFPINLFKKPSQIQMYNYNFRQSNVLNRDETQFPELRNGLCCGPFMPKTARGVITQIRRNEFETEDY